MLCLFSPSSSSSSPEQASSSSSTKMTRRNRNQNQNRSHPTKVALPLFQTGRVVVPKEKINIQRRSKMIQQPPQQHQQLSMGIRVSLVYNHTKWLTFIGENGRIILHF
mmetsp:Transcript_20627/g.23038  ORF Transcript_20627/g.23038 Transcript_20627/m.23038 type:complete len:108 (-) Transcript_20627:7-330(-)